MEVFTDMDVTQSFAATTREFEGASDIDNMTDEEDLLEAYQASQAGVQNRFNPMPEEFNGRVLDHDEDDANIYGHANDIVDEWKNSSVDTFNINDYDLIDMENALSELFPEKYENMTRRSLLTKLKNLENNPELLDDVEEASIEIAKKAYDDSPVFQWDLEEGGFNYQITGNEAYGYTTKIWDDANREATELDVVYSANEAMVQVRSHNDAFMGNGGYGTKWHDEIVHEDAVSTYKETVVTADSPSGTVFTGGKVHFPEDNKAYHLRTTEPDADTLYIEELQSDWANDISKKGVKKGNEPTLQSELDALRARQKAILDKYGFRRNGGTEFDIDSIRFNIMLDDEAKYAKASGQSIRNSHAAFDNMPMEDYSELLNITRNMMTKDSEIKVELERIPQSPLPNDRWINVGLRTAIAQAIDSGKTRVEWTPAQVHIDRWSGQYEKMYKILYDQKLGSIAKKIANTHNAEFGQHYIDISPEMIAHHKSGKGNKLMAATPAIPAAQVANDKEDKS
jgi:hypothetical protein